MRFVAPALLLLILSGCVTAEGTAYGPADSRGFGYEETRIESDRYRIVFRGDGGTPAAAVEDYALLRAAELAEAGGYEWFRVVGRDLAEEEKGGVGIGAGLGTGSYGRNTGVSVGVGGDLGRVGARRFYTARLEVLFGSGDKPSDTEVYDAASVAQSIRARIAGA